MNRFGTLFDDDAKNEKGIIFYVDRNYMDSVFEISSLSDLPQETYDFFMNHDSEILYLLRDGKLQGIIKKEKSQMLRNDQRSSLQNAKYGKNKWYQKELKRFVDHVKASVFIYGIDTDQP